MPLSKARDAERKRLARLEIKEIQPTDYEAFKADLLKDPRVREAYESQQAKYAEIQKLIDSGIAFNIDDDGNVIPEVM